MSDTLLEHPYSYLRFIALFLYLPEASSYCAIHTYTAAEADDVTGLRAAVELRTDWISRLRYEPLSTNTSAWLILYGPWDGLLGKEATWIICHVVRKWGSADPV